jgi:drug/metabolite transporter (DMT)-like permease
VRTLASVLLALGAAATYAVAAVLQQRAASATDRSDSMRLRLFARLLRQRGWILAVGLEVVSYACQATALYFGPLVLVAPIAGLDLLFALPLIARSRRVALSWPTWTAAALVAGGVATFLAVSPPSDGITSPPLAEWVALFIVVGGLLTIGVVATQRSSDRIRAMTLAGIGAIEFGVVAALSKTVVNQVGPLGWATFVHWPLYALAVFGILGTLLAQSAYQAGSLAASLPIVDTVEPISSVLLGAILFHEKLASSPLLLAAQLAGAALAVAGVVIIDRSRLVRDGPADAT